MLTAHLLVQSTKDVEALQKLSYCILETALRGLLSIFFFLTGEEFELLGDEFV